MDEVEVLNGTLKVGDRVAVAVNSRGPSMRVGEVLEIMPGIAGYNQRYGAVRVRVKVDKASGMAGQHFVYDDGEPYSGRWEFRPFTKVYDDPRTMVKLGAMQDAL